MGIYQVVCALDSGSSVNMSIFMWLLSMKIRVKDHFQARFRENVMVKFHRVTRFGVIVKK